MLRLRLQALVIVGAFFSYFCSAVPVFAATTTIPASVETSTYSDKPNTVDTSTHRVWVGMGSGVEKAYLKFPRSFDPSKVTSAQLKLYVFDEDNFHDVTANPTLKFAHNLLIKPQKGEWSEGTLTAAGAATNLSWVAGYGSKAHTVAAGTQRMNWITIDVTDVIKSQTSLKCHQFARSCFYH